MCYRLKREVERERIVADVNLCHEFLNSSSTFVIIGSLYKNPIKNIIRKSVEFSCGWGHRGGSVLANRAR